MSHLRDIQKLRNNRHIQPYPSTSHRFSQPTNPDGININFDRFMEPQSSRTHGLKFSDTYSKCLNSK